MQRVAPVGNNHSILFKETCRCLLAGLLLFGNGIAFGQEKDGIPPPPPGDDGALVDEGPVREFGAPVQELPPSTRVEDIVEPSADYHYAGFGRPDPFQAPVEIQAVVPDAVEIPIVSPLQRYALKDLKLVGVWARNGGERKALVMTPVNEGIIVKVGDPVGSGGGKVISIADAGMVVREFLLAEDGTRQFSDSRIMFELKQDAGAAASGSIVITPGATQPQLMLPASPSPVAGASSANPALAVPPANQVPASGIGSSSAVSGKSGNDQGTAAQASPAPATPTTSPGQNKPVYNF
jgi:Tfp pilus assembly protein PilP